MAPLRPTHLRNRQLRTAIKVQLVDMFANCHLYYQAETWEPLTSSTRQALDSVRNQAYRTATRRHYLTNNNQGTNDDDMHILTNTTDYTTMLRPKRLHYLVSLLQHGPAILLRALDAHHTQTIDQQESDTSSWLSLITSDVAWMAKITTKANSTQRKWTMQGWIEHAHDSPKTFRHQINQARHRSKHIFIDQLATSIWKNKLHTLTTQQSPEPLPTPEPRDYYICYHCGHLSSTQA